MNTLEHLLKEAFSWPRLQEREKSAVLAITLISSKQVEKWKSSGITIKRSCFVSPSSGDLPLSLHSSVHLQVHIAGRKFKMIEIQYAPERKDESPLTVRCAGQLLNGTAPETVEELIALIDVEAEKMLLHI